MAPWLRHRTSRLRRRDRPDPARIEAVIDDKPKCFGEQPEKFHSDAVFLMGIDSTEAFRVFDPREGVDRVWPGDGVICSERLSALRTKSRLRTIDKSMTIRRVREPQARPEVAGWSSGHRAPFELRYGIS